MSDGAEIDDPRRRADGCLSIGPDDPDNAATHGPQNLNGMMCIPAAVLRMTIGVRHGDVEDMLLMMGINEQTGLYSVLTPSTARIFGEEMLSWAARHEEAAADIAAEAIGAARAPGQ